jgi:very-short-patch-repair endonuclease
VLELHPGIAYAHADLKAAGLSQARITDLVRRGGMLRPRQGLYLHPATSPDRVVASRVGGLLGCTSALSALGVFVLDQRHVHVHVPPHATRLRTAGSNIRVHWAPTRRTPHPRSLEVDVFDALLQAIVCQAPRAAIATLDSALHLGVIDGSDLDELFRYTPKRRRALRPLVDGRAESGPETFVRLLLRALGLRFECQVSIPGVGRVDFLVEGWLVIECDSRAHHGGWQAQVADRRRDLLLAERGYACLRPVAADIFTDAAKIGEAITGILGALAPQPVNIPAKPRRRAA